MTVGARRGQVRDRLLATHQFPPVPEEWGVVRFRFVFQESKERNGSAPVGEMLSVSGYRGVEIKAYEFEERRRLDEDLEDYRVVRPGQLVVNTMWLNHRGLGVSRVLGHVSPAYAVYDISPDLDPAYVHHLLRSDYYLNVFKSYLYGIRPNSFQIKDSDWLSIPILVPPASTQRVIADFLDQETARIDQLIEKKERLVCILEEKRRVVAIHCLSRGMSDLYWDNDTHGIRFIFAQPRWSERTIKSLVEFMTSGSRGWGELLGVEGEGFIQSGNIGRRMEVDLNFSQRVQPQTGAEADRTLVKSGDVLVCITGGRTGAVGFVREIGERAYINQHVCLLRADRRVILPELLAHLLWSDIGQKQIELCQYGLKQGLGFNEVAQIRVPVPPLHQQQCILLDITRATRSIDSVVERTQESVARLRELRSALITAAVTGQLDVATWSKRGETDRRLEAIEHELEAELEGAAV